MSVRKTTQYGGNHVQGLLNNPWFSSTWFRRALKMVLKLCARPPKQPMVLLYTT